jgi:hypothetical protein
MHTFGLDWRRYTRQALAHAVCWNPFDAFPKAVLSDFIEQHYPGHGDLTAARQNRFPIGRKVRMLIAALKGCKIAYRTWPWRFANGLPLQGSLSPKQFVWLVHLLHRYRRSCRSDAVRRFAAQYYDRYCILLKFCKATPTDDTPG